MFDNWLKSWEDMYSYKTFKKTINNYNQKVINFWKDFYNDVFSNIKRED
jgi:hypothetical protein